MTAIFQRSLAHSIYNLLHACVLKKKLYLQFTAYYARSCLHQNLKGESQELESSQNHVSKESIACGSEPADSDAALESAFFK